MKMETKACAKGFTELTWPQTAPAQQPATVYQHSDVVGDGTALAQLPTFTTLATLTLPAGTYDYRAVISLSGSGAYDVLCDIPFVNDKEVSLTNHGQVVLEGAGTDQGGSQIVRCAVISGSATATATFTAEPVTLHAQ